MRHPGRNAAMAFRCTKASAGTKKCMVVLGNAFSIWRSLVALLLLSPVMAVVALLVHLNLDSPVLFRQQRPGVGGRPFLLMKFRTMTNARDANGELLPDEQRITRFGQMLRHTSLDELPELINVLTGDMSPVGPRSDLPCGPLSAKRALCLYWPPDGGITVAA